jgi:multiple sugar transport system permease protein
MRGRDEEPTSSRPTVLGADLAAHPGGAGVAGGIRPAAAARLARLAHVGRRSRAWAALPFLLPGLLLFTVFVLWPIAQGVRVSFYDWNIMPGAEQHFVGLDNYRRALTDPVVRVAGRNTLLYVVVTVSGQMAVGMLVALGLHAQVRARGVWRTVYYIPVVTSWVVVSFVFKYLFLDGRAGPVNFLLTDVLRIVPSHIEWLQNAWTAQVPINLLGIWKGIGWAMVIFLAGLSTIPPELQEAAAVDGANPRQVFWRITLPLLKPVILFVLVMLTIGGFQVFISVLLLTRGGPLDGTQVMLTYMYKQGFSYFDFGYGFAIAAMLAAVIFVISVAQFRWLDRSHD